MSLIIVLGVLWLRVSFSSDSTLLCFLCFLFMWRLSHVAVYTRASCVTRVVRGRGYSTLGLDNKGVSSGRGLLPTILIVGGISSMIGYDLLSHQVTSLCDDKDVCDDDDKDDNRVSVEEVSCANRSPFDAKTGLPHVLPKGKIR